MNGLKERFMSETKTATTFLVFYEAAYSLSAQKQVTSSDSRSLRPLHPTPLIVPVPEYSFFLTSELTIRERSCSLPPLNKGTVPAEPWAPLRLPPLPWEPLPSP